VIVNSVKYVFQTTRVCAVFLQATLCFCRLLCVSAGCSVFLQATLCFCRLLCVCVILRQMETSVVASCTTTMCWLTWYQYFTCQMLRSYTWPCA